MGKFILRPQYFSVSIFLVALILGPLRQLDFFANMPGDIADARLNNYFLESIYQYVFGTTASFLHPEFFYPYPFVSGFSDNLVGASPIYISARYFSFSPEVSFQLWFICGYLANFIASLIALRMFKISIYGATIGALFFTFGLPASAQMGHAQLQYRFGIPLSIVYLYQFFLLCDPRKLFYSCFWLLWQFLLSIYLGFFSLLFMVIMAAYLMLMHEKLNPGNKKKNGIIKFFSYLISNLELKNSIIIIFSILFYLISFFILFFPYLKVNSIYHFRRSWVEVAAMLPRLESYILADHSLLWGSLSKTVAPIPIRWEQQLFIGLFPVAIIAITIILNRSHLNSYKNFAWIPFSLLTLVVLTINFHDHSLWFYFVSLPLFSAIRAVSRIILLFLFPVSIILALAIDALMRKYSHHKRYLHICLSLLLIIETTAVIPTISSKNNWLERISSEQSRLPSTLIKNPILFFAQRSSFFEQEELDAMMVSQKLHLPTLNGYSGALPHHFRAEYADDCAEYPRRILLYLYFINQHQNKEAYSRLAQRVETIGFVGCHESWRSEPPMTISNQILSADEIAALALEHPIDTDSNLSGYIKVRITNHGRNNISAISSRDTPLRLAWRFIGPNRAPLSTWEQPQTERPFGIIPQGYRRDLPADIPAGGFVDILAPRPKKTMDEAKAVEFTLVQEETLWGYSLDKKSNSWSHDQGVSTLVVDLSQ